MNEGWSVRQESWAEAAPPGLWKRWWQEAGESHILKGPLWLPCGDQIDSW